MCYLFRRDLTPATATHSHLQQKRSRRVLRKHSILIVTCPLWVMIVSSCWPELCWELPIGPTALGQLRRAIPQVEFLSEEYGALVQPGADNGPKFPSSWVSVYQTHSECQRLQRREGEGGTRSRSANRYKVSTRRMQTYANARYSARSMRHESPAE